ncbi:MAG: hypothetical protein KAS90_04265 [Candidatus Aenigmarchaeota archaeon]|nr:hypothetical protein [Candidatus Aenigmarchaeota archaeon]
MQIRSKLYGRAKRDGKLTITMPVPAPDNYIAMAYIGMVLLKGVIAAWH